MAVVHLPADDEVDGVAADLYDADCEAMGDVPNYTRLFARRPDVLDAWKQLNAGIRSHLDVRRYEVATLGAATALRSSYCALAHGKILAEQLVGVAGCTT